MSMLPPAAPRNSYSAGERLCAVALGALCHASFAVAFYCVAGPRLKEGRMLARDPDGYRRYQTLVPYWLPQLRPSAEDRDR